VYLPLLGERLLLDERRVQGFLHGFAPEDAPVGEEEIVQFELGRLHQKISAEILRESGHQLLVVEALLPERGQIVRALFQPLLDEDGVNEFDDVGPAIVHRNFKNWYLKRVRLRGHARREFVMKAVEFESDGGDSLLVHPAEEGGELFRVVLEDEAASHQKLPAAHPAVGVRSFEDRDGADFAPDAAATGEYLKVREQVFFQQVGDDHVNSPFLPRLKDVIYWGLLAEFLSCDDIAFPLLQTYFMIK